ncbi:ABC transporter ATP-binding protein [uncultured Bacteroides sp.]|uniref:ABC transporter ATP-binding protein n=1 Tax=uncultured Bacteroides sp. TaxID=162156 RepID=UPI0025D5A08E|nr:ABC transporter ATP-binding protein [uncultured Bacteroides sp.]
MNTIEINGISKSYGAVKALDGITLSVHKAELFGLIGPDGAGKTTLFRILTTLLNPDCGTASVAGLDVRQQYRDIRNVVGYMPGRFSLYPDLSVSENLDFFAALFGVDVRTNYELIAPIYNQIAPFAGRRAGKLSGGMKQKLALCCALIHRPAILFLDEPTTGVDAVSRSEFWQMLAELKDKGITIFVSTPYMDEAQACDRVALIDKGRILAIDTPTRLSAGSDKNLYEVSAREMWSLMLALRKLPQVADCYTFGEAHHVVTKEGFDPSATAEALERSGLHDVSISPAEGNIEDLFIKLMRNG